MMPDHEAERIRGLAAGLKDATARRWIEELLADRDERVRLTIALARRLVELRRRLFQAGRYLAGLAGEASALAASPWPGRQRCPRCGAPAVQVDAVPTPDAVDGQSHRLAYVHPDGSRCPER